MDANLRDWASFEDFICERDGAFRDINFTNPTWNGLRNLVSNFAQRYHQKSATDENGSVTEVLSDVVKGAARQPGGLRVSYNSGIGWVSEFQVWFGIEEDDAPCVEISFHPDDVIHSDDTQLAFLAWADEVKLILDADSYTYG